MAQYLRKTYTEENVDGISPGRKGVNYGTCGGNRGTQSLHHPWHDHLLQYSLFTGHAVTGRRHRPGEAHAVLRNSKQIRGREAYIMRLRIL
jgi:hypothetical protein